MSCRAHCAPRQSQFQSSGVSTPSFPGRVGIRWRAPLSGYGRAGPRNATYIPGSVPVELFHHTDEHLAAAAKLLRSFHDTTALFPGGAEVICHNDFSPGNCVYVDGRPTAMIDFDTLAPGTRLWDLGYSVPCFVNMGHPDYNVEEEMRRLRLLPQPTACHPASLSIWRFTSPRILHPARGGRMTCVARTFPTGRPADETGSWPTFSIPCFPPAGLALPKCARFLMKITRPHHGRIGNGSFWPGTSRHTLVRAPLCSVQLFTMKNVGGARSEEASVGSSVATASGCRSAG